MKITKRQLKRIIKEEKRKLLREALDDPADIMGGSLDAPLMGDPDTARILYDVLLPALESEGIRGPELVTTLRAAADLIQSDMEDMLG